MNQLLNIYGDLINIEYINNIKLIDCIYYILSLNQSGVITTMKVGCMNLQHCLCLGCIFYSYTSWCFLTCIAVYLLLACLPMIFPFNVVSTSVLSLLCGWNISLIIFHDQLFSLPASFNFCIWLFVSIKYDLFISKSTFPGLQLTLVMSSLSTFLRHT